jgi:COP9 signalosome complex subunit 4
MSRIDRKLEGIVNLELKDQINGFTKLIDELIGMGASEDSIVSFDAIIAKIFSDIITPQVTKSVILHFSKAIKALTGDMYESIASNTLKMIKSKPLIVCDEADTIIREDLFTYHLSCGEFRQASMVLSGIKLDSNARLFTDFEKADIYIRCAEAFSLDENGAIDAEVFCNKAAQLINNVDDVRLQIRYRAIFARVLDSNRKFQDASQKYYDLSCATFAGLDTNSEDLLTFLGNSVTCAVLAKSGPQRTRLLGQLYNDPRTLKLDLLSNYTTHSNIISRMHLLQLLRHSELKTFVDSLSPHQKAITSEGFTVPELAIIEHNMLATGKIYANITFNELGEILGVDANKSEKISAKMISENRLNASIDQTEGRLIFQDDDNILISWDNKINDVCSLITNQVESIQQNYPQWSLL